MDYAEYEQITIIFQVFNMKVFNGFYCLSILLQQSINPKITRSARRVLETNIKAC